MYCTRCSAISVSYWRVLMEGLPKPSITITTWTRGSVAIFWWPVTISSVKRWTSSSFGGSFSVSTRSARVRIAPLIAAASIVPIRWPGT